MAYASHEPHAYSKGSRALAVLCTLLLLVLLARFSARRPEEAAKWQPQQFHEDRQQEYDSWRSVFVAADPAWQQFCDTILSGGRISGQGAQYSQDFFVFLNLFRKLAMDGRKGFYVESGANDPIQLSTSE